MTSEPSVSNTLNQGHAGGELRTALRPRGPITEGSRPGPSLAAGVSRPLRDTAPAPRRSAGSPPHGAESRSGELDAELKALGYLQ